MKGIYITLILLITLSCSSSQKVVEDIKCPKTYQNNFTEILIEEYIAVSDTDSIPINEVRFECVNSALNTHKVMYDTYGKWTEEIYANESQSPLLRWENIDLFKNGKKYTVVTNGRESYKHIYASVMVFDEKGKDIFSEPTDEKLAVVNLFADLIKNNNFVKKDFYEAYWKTVDPKHWERLRRYNRN